MLFFRHSVVQLSSVLDRTHAEMLLVQVGGDVWLSAAGTFETAKITNLSHKRTFYKTAFLTFAS